LRVNRMIRTLRSVLPGMSCLLVAALAGPAGAAEGGAMAGIRALRTEMFLNASKREALDEWIAKQIELILDENADLSERQKIRSLFQRVVRDQPAPSLNFKENLAESILRLFKPHLKEGDALGALTMAMILKDLRDILPKSALRKDGGLLAGLSHPVTAVKYWTARTIQLLHRKFADLPGPRAATIAALCEAGMNETDGEVLREIYRALDFGRTMGKIDYGEEAVAALVDVLEVRGERYAAGEVEVSEGDLVGLVAMRRMSGKIVDANQAKLRQRYLTALARMLYRVAEDYMAQLGREAELSRQRKLALRRLFLVCAGIENEFRRIVEGCGVAEGKTLPDLRARMPGGIKEEIQLELNKWCGLPPNTKGALNDDALGVPIGAGYAEIRAKASETQPASSQPEKPKEAATSGR